MAGFLVPSKMCTEQQVVKIRAPGRPSDADLPALTDEAIRRCLSRSLARPIAISQDHNAVDLLWQLEGTNAGSGQRRPDLKPRRLNYGKTSLDSLAHRKLYPHLGESHGATDAAAEHCFVRHHGSFSAPVMP
jgi:hypothetical protein